MIWYFVSLLVVYTTIGILIYRILYRKKRLMNDRFAMVMAMSCSSILSLTISMILQFLVPNDLLLPLIISVVVGSFLGVLFGALVKFQSLLAGFSNGVVGGFMGSMLGAVIKDPSICSLPASYLTSIEQNMVIFSVFGTILVFSTIFLVYYALRI
jgi:hypothetical protein